MGHVVGSINQEENNFWKGETIKQVILGSFSTQDVGFKILFPTT
jgi:hypothetical protein